MFSNLKACTYVCMYKGYKNGIDLLPTDFAGIFEFSNK